MFPVGKALRVCKASFKAVLIKANVKMRKRKVNSYIPFRPGNLELCSIKMRLWSTLCRPVYRECCHILVSQAILALSNKKPSTFLIPTVKQKGCSHKNLLLHVLDKDKARQVAYLPIPSGSCPQAPPVQLVPSLSCSQELHTAQHQPWTAQVNCWVDHYFLSVQ